MRMQESALWCHNCIFQTSSAAPWSDLWLMRALLTFSRFMLFRVASIPFTTPAMDLVTCERVKGHSLQIFQHDTLSFFFLRKYVYLVHGDGGLDSRRHSVHSSAHSQEVHGLVLLSDGVLGVDPRDFRVTFLDCLDNNTHTNTWPKGSCIVLKWCGSDHSPSSLWPSLLSLPCRISLRFAAALWLRTSG